ncbi:unnamed protein product [Alternaria alternata]|jgi:hypothetical protein|uniref:Rhodopsin domain-containing protein n=3 Tax=Alternaria alternata complex TaxID=187734 RepID=A0A177DG45_ALTAL|nr:hypothetical protein CC77DRAFT_1062761 [Alternaria alternata]RII15256.1 hypothetical protein CUC08_Gglean003723 [Alternaria sp. MG1]RYN19124.1 hypothetical protein AA0115_g10961 [Alternaria tenuissima]OAG18834.1 hypothetical protein CC77DRAFT_1062761 [Alternaria alternata]OWY46790.1 integral membrane protein [Alternaria alternata]RYN74993.1 hypothetical protein AA0120_g12173 [Alternaria tenuissima]
MAGSLSDNPRGRQAVEISTVFTGLAFIVVCLRLYTRFFLIRCVGIEDAGIALAMLCSIGLTICIGVQAKNGMGRHTDTINDGDMTTFLRAFWASLIVYYLSLGLTKGSMLLQYRRIFPTKSFQVANWITMAVVISYTIWTVFSSIFMCVPVRAFWTHEKATCLNQFAVWFTNAAINIITDFAIILLPIPVIRKLNLGKRQKIGLISIFAIGGFVCLVSILRLQSLVAISNSADPSYDNPPAATWSSVESNVGIICACLPLLRPLITKWLPRAFPSRHRSIYSHSRPQNRTYGSRGGSKALRTKDDYVLDVTKRSNGSSEEGRDIQVVTDIHVEVDGADGRRISGWRTPASQNNWSDNISGKETQRENSTESLVNQHVRVSSR